MKVAIVGIGLIGGSIAMDLRAASFASELIGIDLQGDHEAKALELGLVDKVDADERALPTSDLIILAIPVSTICGLLPTLLDVVKKDAVIMDVGSTKGAICRAAAHHPNRSQFVAAHPLAGTEHSGPQAAITGLFRNKLNIICEKEKSSERSLNVAGRVFDALSMRTIYMDAEEHDRHVAYVSHLSHVSSFLLGQTVLDIEKDEENIFELASSGFASTVRLAKSSPATWAPIFEQNADFLGQALMEYIMHLQKFHYLLVKRDTKGIQEILTRANEIGRILEGIELKNAKKANTETQKLN